MSGCSRWWRKHSNRAAGSVSRNISSVVPNGRDSWTDSYYKTQLGTITDYLSAAHAAGFELEQDEDITDGVAEFWVQSMAWTTAELDKPGKRSPITRERLTESALTHGKLFRIWRDHAVETRQLKFRLAA